MNKIKTSISLALLAMLLLPLKGWAYNTGDIIPFTLNGVPVGFKVLKPDNKGQTVVFLGKEKDKSTTEITVPSTITYGGFTWTVTAVAGDNGAYNYSGVTKVTLPETIDSLGSKPFSGAQLTEPIHLYKAFRKFPPNGFQDIVPKVVVSDDNTEFSSDADGSLYNKAKTKLYSVPTVGATLSADGTYTIASTVEEMGIYSFWLPEGMKKIVFPEGLKKFPTQLDAMVVFGNPKYLTAYEISSNNTLYKTIDGVLFSTAANTSPNTPNTLLSYPRGKVNPKENPNDASSLSTYKVPDGIITIASEAIYSVDGLQKIDLNEVETFQPKALDLNVDLRTVKLSKTMNQNSTTGGISGSTQITAYEVADGNTQISAQDGVIYNADKTAIIFYPPAKPGDTYEIPASVTTLASGAFRYAQYIKTLTIPATVKTIQENSLSNITNLISLTFEDTEENPSQLQTLANSAVQASKITEVRLPRSLKQIGFAFFNTPSLKKVIIPDGSQLTTINSQAFFHNTGLTDFVFEGSTKLETIGSKAFYNETKANQPKLTGFKFPETLKSIGSEAFRNMSSLKSVDFSEAKNLVSIGANAFQSTSLEKVELPTSLKTLEREAFRDVTSLKEVRIGSEATSIDPLAFRGSSNLVNLDVDPQNQTYSSVRGYLMNKAKTKLIYYPEGKDLNGYKMRLASSLTEIGPYAFFQNKHITDVVIPAKVTKIGTQAFGSANNLKQITFLTEKMIPGSTYDRSSDNHTFANGNVGQNNMSNIKIRVRKTLVDQYKNDAFYRQFANGSNPETSFFSADGDEYMPYSSDKNNIEAYDRADLLDVKRDVVTYVVPEKVEDAAATDGKEYTVSMISDYAFQNQNQGHITEVVIKHPLTFIGAQAFVTNIADGTSKIESVFFTTTNPKRDVIASQHFFLDETGNNYSEIAPTTTMYVKPSQLSNFVEMSKKKISIGRAEDNTAIEGEETQFNYYSQIKTNIPFAIPSKYATFAREFDADFSQAGADKATNKVAAFVGLVKGLQENGGDHGDASNHFTMSSIDVNTTPELPSYSYVPANTGVMIKLLDNNTTTSNDLYYTIGENDGTQYTVADNIMHGVTETNSSIVAPNASTIYVMSASRGVFLRVGENRLTTVDGVRQLVNSNTGTFKNVHRAYLLIEAPSLARQASYMPYFPDLTDRNTTGIETIAVDTTANTLDDNAPIYTLSGQKVEKPLARGIYIQNGKKIIVK